MDEVAVLTDLLEAYSPSGHEDEATRAFVAASDDLGFRTDVDEVGNAFARIGSGRPQILFLGHIDTVDGEIPVHIRAGRIYGRGACDAKGSLAAALLAANGHEGRGELVVAAAVGEEKDSRGARFLIPQMAPDFLIVGEPSGWDRITIAYKGNLSVVLTFGGTRTHLSAPNPTTVETALAFLEQVRAFAGARREDSVFASLTAKVPEIQTHRNGSDEVVEMTLNFRLPTTMKAQEVLAFLDEAGLAGSYRVVDRSEAVEVDRRNPVATALSAGVWAVGGRVTLIRKAGTSDLNLALPVWGCPAAAYGPGDSHLDHTDEENLEIEEFRKSIRVLAHAFEALARLGP